MAQSTPLFSSTQAGVIDDSTKQKYLDEEKERLRLFELQEQRRRQAAGGLCTTDVNACSFNPFATVSPAAPAAVPGVAAQPSVSSTGSASSSKPSDDLLGLFDMMPAAGGIAATSGYRSNAVPQPFALDPTNPFAQSVLQQQATPVITNPMPGAGFPGYQNVGSTNAFGADFATAFNVGAATNKSNVGFNPFLVGGTTDPPFIPQCPIRNEGSEKQWSANVPENANVAAGWSALNPQADLGDKKAVSWNKTAESSESGDEAVANTGNVSLQTSEVINLSPRNPFETLHENAGGNFSKSLRLGYFNAKLSVRNGKNLLVRISS
ncbi:unnamed protein product [Thelazia callipaeda]|uniref:Clathrin light chain n=1 Tax=Thelazia callipaeda TaxID=103827 RepID=A0A0N5CTA3_THECL|nr:unnamed protein product [Thelazia callipaeda]